MYVSVAGQGDFQYAVCTAIMDNGSIVDWELMIRYWNPGHSCSGIWVFRQTSPSAEPVGDFCIFDSGSTDCTKGQASIVDDN